MARNGFAGRRRDGLAHGRADHDAADQTGAGRGRNAVEIAEAQAGRRHGPADQPVQMVEMGARGDLRHDAFIGPVVLDLGQQRFRQNFRRAVCGRGARPLPRSRRNWFRCPGR